MEYPRLLKLSEKKLDNLRSYLDRELLAHRAERSKWVDDLKRWQEDYWSTPSSEQAEFPYRGAANFVIPLTAIAVEAIHAREMTTLFALNQFVHVNIQNAEAQDLRNDLERSIDRELIKGVDIYKFCDQTLLENKKLGTCVGKTDYEKIIKTAVREVGGEEQEFQVIVRQGPTAYAVPVANFLMPFIATDPQYSPWVGEEHLANFYTLEQGVDSGLFDPDLLEDLQAFFAQSQQLSSTPYTQSVRSLQNQLPIEWPREVGWNEIWLEFDIDSDDAPRNNDPAVSGGANKEIVVHYHWPSRTFFSIRYNWRSDLSRPYRIGNYFPMEHRWAGIGVGKQNEQFQELATTIERQRVDNATLANMRMFKAKQGSGIGPNEPFFPGRIFLLDEMDDFEPIVGGSEIYPSDYNNSQQAVIYSQQRTGVNEMTLGMPQSGTPGTATSDVQRVQEQTRKFDYTFKNSKRFLKQITLDILCQQSEFGFRDRRWFDTLGQNGQMIEQMLSIDPADIQSELYFEVEIVGQSNNDALDRNNWTQFAGMLTQYWTEMMGMVQQTGNPQLIQAVMAQAMSAATEAMKQISQGFDIRGAERLLLPQQLIAALSQQPGQSNGPNQLQPGRGGQTSTSSTSQRPGVRSPIAVAR